MSAPKRNYLLPGAYIATAEPMHVSTILGSCVAVAFHDPTTKTSGLCHYLLSRIVEATGPIARYGDQAIPLLYDELVTLGANPRALIAKVYGGANVLGNVAIGMDVGKKNIAIAHEILESLKVPIIKEDTGGTRGRKLLLSTNTFEIQQVFMEKSGVSIGRKSVQKPLRALIVDPAPKTHGDIEKLLIQSGLTIIQTVSDVFDAFRVVTSEKPDVLIFGLPNKSKSELQLIRDLKKMTSLPPFYVYSIGGSGLQATQALDLGANDFVHCDTSFDPEALRTVATMLTEKIRESA